MAEALYGPATLVEGAATLFPGVQVLSHIRSPQPLRVGTRDQHVAAAFATHPGTPSRIRIRGGAEVVALVGRARWSVGAPKTTRCLVASKYAEEATSRSLRASARSGRTRDRVQGHTRRWRVEIVQSDYDSSRLLSLTAA
jgi:hypothetical protein